MVLNPWIGNFECRVQASGFKHQGALGLIQILDHEVCGGEGGGGDGLLMRPLAVDDAGVVLAPLPVHGVPHLRLHPIP